MKKQSDVDVVIIGAGAAGLMCAIEAGKRGRRVLVLERNKTIGEKIRISGGGRCNFTNIYASHANYISENPHFCKSAFARFTPDDFLSLLEKHGVSYHEKKLGQLFCDSSSRQILDMLQNEVNEANVQIISGCSVKTITKEEKFIVSTNTGEFTSESLVVATGGLSIPKLGATDFGYQVAKQFGLKVNQTKPGLVPLTFTKKDIAFFSELSGVSVDAIVSCNGISFRENILFTHRGLSGPAILQISSYRNQDDIISINLSPDIDLHEYFKERQQLTTELVTVLAELFPKRFAQLWCERFVPSMPMNRFTLKKLSVIASQLHLWELKSTGTEGYAKAEVTCGGIDTNELSSKTMEAKNVQGLFFIGEVVDVTGQLGGFNFQWAWASGFVAGQYV
ncbi:MAG: NAD(P)/FAD-dependent oxidoreductase [Ignavibacteriae bacterium]|nr:NAD(P)/FAD-dependent oxidoreductase [Ignavibacteriota bacterium]